MELEFIIGSVEKRLTRDYLRRTVSGQHFWHNVETIRNNVKTMLQQFVALIRVVKIVSFNVALIGVS